MVGEAECPTNQLQREPRGRFPRIPRFLDERPDSSRAMRCVALLSLLLLTACWTPQHEDGAWQALVTQTPESRATIEAPSPVGRSSPERQGDAYPQPGDAVVYAFDVETPDSTSRRFLRFTVGRYLGDDGQPQNRNAVAIIQTRQTLDGVEQPVERERFTVAVLPVEVAVFDAEGELLGKSVVEEALTGFLHKGLFDGVQRRISEEGIPNLSGNYPIEYAVVSLLQEDEELRAIAFELTGWSIGLTAIWSLGVNISISSSPEDAVRVDPDAITGRPAYRFPMQLAINGRPMLRVGVTVVDPFPPLGVSAGVTRVDGFRATDDRYRFSLQFVPSGVPK